MAPWQAAADTERANEATDRTRLPLCGVKTRAGTLWRRPAGWGTEHVGEGRCKLHGGRSPRGPLHPRYKHGRYAKYEVVVTWQGGQAMRVGVNDAKVQFDEQGRCLGIVQIGTGPEIDPPRPLRPQDVEVFRQVPGYTVTVRRRGRQQAEPQAGRSPSSTA